MPGYQIAHFGLKRQYKNLKDELLDATDRAMKDGQLIGGHYTRSFEEWLKYKTKTKFAITVHSGTQALEIIARWKKIKHNETMAGNPKVLIPNLTYPATLNAFLTAGWDIELVDTDKNGIICQNREPQGGIYNCFMGFAGRRPWVESLYKNSFSIIVDGAQHWLSNNATRIGNATAISFDPMKNLANYGNGGAVVTPDFGLAEFARSWRDNGKPGNYIVGTNSRMSEIDCAQMLVKTKYIDQWQVRRAKIADYWCERLKGHDKIRCLINEKTRKGHCFHKFVIEVDSADIVQRNLNIRKIDTKVHYRQPLHELPIYQQFAGPDMMSVASMLGRRVLSLPLYPELTDLEIEYIIDQLLDSV